MRTNKCRIMVLLFYCYSLCVGIMITIIIIERIIMTNILCYCFYLFLLLLLFLGCWDVLSVRKYKKMSPHLNVVHSSKYITLYSSMNVTSLYQVKCRNMLVLREMVGNLINIIALYYMAFVKRRYIFTN